MKRVPSKYSLTMREGEMNKKTRAMSWKGRKETGREDGLQGKRCEEREREKKQM